MFIKLAVPALLTGLILTGCGREESDQDTVVTGFYPLAYVAERVAGDRMEVVNLTTPGGEPHDLELGPAQTADLADADLVVSLPGFQPAVDASVETNSTGSVLHVDDVITLAKIDDHEEGHSEEGHSEEDEHAHEHGDTDPHFWQDSLLMADLGEAMAEELADLDPDHAKEYRENSAALRSDLEALDQEYETGLSGCAIDVVVVSHDAFGYLGRYGLHFEPIAGLSPDAEPSPAELARLDRLIRKEGVTTVFSERLATAEFAETLAREAGVETAVLDPIEGLSDQTADSDYLSLMRANLAALREANRC